MMSDFMFSTRRNTWIIGSKRQRRRRRRVELRQSTTSKFTRTQLVYRSFCPEAAGRSIWVFPSRWSTASRVLRTQTDEEMTSDCFSTVKSVFIFLLWPDGVYLNCWQTEKRNWLVLFSFIHSSIDYFLV